MRIKLSLIAQNTDYLTADYHHSLSASIYNSLQFGSKEFSEFLHDKGFILKGRSYKLFSYALRFNRIIYEGKFIKLLDRNISLIISSPMVDEFIKSFVLGTFMSKQIEIFGNYKKIVFAIKQAELLPVPEFDNHTKFRLLSPLVLSIKKSNERQTYAYYLRHDDDINIINRALNQNLINKFYLVNGTPFSGENLILQWDNDYIQQRINENKRLTKKISITSDIHNPIDIIGINVPFSVMGNPELIKIGYLAGFGEKNSMGFGLTEVID